MSGFSIRVCTGVPADSPTRFQLRAPPRAAGSLVLITWKAEPPPVDAGVPEVVTQVLARALTTAHRVTFPTDMTVDRNASQWTRQGEAQVRLLRPSGASHRLDALLKREPRAIALASTCEAATARALFDVADYPWELQAMAVLLSAPDAAPPNIDYATFVNVLNDAEGGDWAVQQAPLASCGVQAVLRAGVDGDLCGLFVPPGHAVEPLLTALEHEARGAGVEWAQCTFDRFA